MLQFKIIPVTKFQQNCTLFWCDETQKAAVVDPGGDLDIILAAISEEGLTLEKVLLTHAHIDFCCFHLQVSVRRTNPSPHGAAPFSPLHQLRLRNSTRSLLGRCASFF